VTSMIEGRDVHDHGAHHDQDVAAAGLADWSLGRLLSTAARLVEHDWNDWLATYDLTHAGLLALHALQAGPLTQRQLAAANRVGEQTMGRVLARLERAGYVSRERDAADRRRLVISWTAHGAEIFARVQDDQVSDRLVAQWLKDPQQFRAELVRIVASARRSGAIDSSAASVQKRTAFVLSEASGLRSATCRSTR
jgi:MarR family transcriptional regulator, organic hydroperoxide resistance regulator